MDSKNRVFWNKIKRLREDRMPWSKIAKNLRVTEDTLRRKVRQSGINFEHVRGKVSARRVIQLFDARKSAKKIAEMSGISVAAVRAQLFKAGRIHKQPPLRPVNTKFASKLLRQGWTLGHIGIEMGLTYHRLRKELMKAGCNYKRSAYRDININKAKGLYAKGYTYEMIGVVLRCSGAHVSRQFKLSGITLADLQNTRASTNRTQRRATRVVFRRKYGHLIKCPPSPIRGNFVHKKRVTVVTCNGVRYTAKEFPDIEKLRMICRFIRNDYYGIMMRKTEQRRFVEHTYQSDRFAFLVESWRRHSRNKWWRPSIDHKIPMSRGGPHEVKNIQFLTRFENVMKADRTAEEWRIFRETTNTKSDLFVENIFNSKSRKV